MQQIFYPINHPGENLTVACHRHPTELSLLCTLSEWIRAQDFDLSRLIQNYSLNLQFHAYPHGRLCLYQGKTASVTPNYSTFLELLVSMVNASGDSLLFLIGLFIPFCSYRRHLLNFHVVIYVQGSQKIHIIELRETKSLNSPN